MSKKKGVSAEEKKSRMLQLFYEKNEFFQLKELEKLGPKEKGVVAQSVKDVIQNLVDDGLVDTDKIGTSVFFWAYPNKAIMLRKKRIMELNQAIEQKSKKLKLAQETLASSKQDNEDVKERTELMERLKELQEKKATLSKEVNKFADTDPSLLDNLKKQTNESKDAANRWTDNIFAIKAWCKNKFMVEESTLDKQFGIPADLDYIN